MSSNHNLDQALTAYVSVTDFIAGHSDDTPTLIAGLLDYGYSIRQVAQMLDTRPSEIVETMTVNNLEERV